VNHDISVITPSLPSRARFLEECVASVVAQLSDASHEHLFKVDHAGAGCAVTVNELAATADGDWLLRLDDDDLLLPGAFDSLLGATRGAEIVYSPPLVTGNADRWWFFQAPPLIPATALISRVLWTDLGGYDETLKHEEDRDFWTRALDAGARCARVDDPCWVYRMHSSNKSFNKDKVPA
jgi:glycosyltransferase involved in cell wall biosynthesis